MPLYRPAFKTGARISVADGLSAARGVHLRSTASARKRGKPIKYAPLPVTVLAIQLVAINLDE